MNVRCICHVFLQNSIECSLFVDDEKHLSIKCIDIYLWKHVLDNISTDTQCAVSSYILFNRSEKWNLVKWSIIPSVIVCLFLDFELRVTEQKTIRLEFNISETKLPPFNIVNLIYYCCIINIVILWDHTNHCYPQLLQIIFLLQNILYPTIHSFVTKCQFSTKGRVTTTTTCFS